MSIQGSNPDWNSFGRANASKKWRKQSAAMGHDMTQAIVEAADVRRGMRVLDLACGTGEPAISLAELLENSGEVIGVDISPAPLKIAEERALQRGLANARFQQADAHDLPFAADSFDRVTSRLGVMFFSNLQKALREIKRVLKPGGAAILMAWGPMHQQPYFSTTIGTVLQELPGAVMSQAAKSVFTFGEKDVLAQAFREAGFSSVHEQFITVPWTWPGTPEEVWDYFQDVAVPFAPLLQSIPPEKREEIDGKVLRAIRKYDDDGKIQFTANVNLTKAVK